MRVGTDAVAGEERSAELINSAIPRVMHSTAPIKKVILILVELASPCNPGWVAMMAAEIAVPNEEPTVRKTWLKLTELPSSWTATLLAISAGIAA